ncbi:MAG: hypothetical protein IPL47_03420 [Phyllobacteriaceae bacterium]|nr:hypothetical protein [Phyllobacteriaceae bacterium]
MAKPATVRIENVLQPGKTYPVDAAKFEAMKKALLAVVPDMPPGITPEEIIARVKPSLPDDLFPGGSTVGWWVKSVQLDQEAKGVIARSFKPVRLYKK